MLLALSLRVAGLGWGLPAPGRDYPYHPDEPVVALAALQVDFPSLQLSPRFYNYGSLQIYLNKLAFDTAVAAGWVRPATATPEQRARTLGAVIRIGRWLAVLMGVLTIVAAAALGARLFGERTGALAAILLAAAALHLAQGHYSTVDVPAALWTTLCLLLCAGALQAPGRGALVAAGLCAGLAASTKYNAGLVLLAPLFTLAATWRREEWYASERAAALVYTPLAAAAAFLITTPGIFIDTEQFWAALRYEIAHTGTGHGLVFVQTPPAWLYHLTRSLPDGLGHPLALAVVVGVVTAAVRRRAVDGILLAFILPYFLLIGMAEVKFARYLLPILPALIVLAARLLVGPEPTGYEDVEGAPRGDRERGKRSDTDVAPSPPRSSAPTPTPTPTRPLPGRLLALLRWAAALALVPWTIAYAVAMALVFVQPDPRDQAADWIISTRPRGQRVAVASDPWFYTPPLVPSIGCTHVMLRRLCGQPLPAWIQAPASGQGALPVEELHRVRPAFVVMSEFEYADPLRLRDEIGHADPMTTLVDAVQQRYQLVRTFRSRPSLGPLRWFTQNPPVHDLLYPMPDVRVYRRR